MRIDLQAPKTGYARDAVPFGYVRLWRNDADKLLLID